MSTIIPPTASGNVQLDPLDQNTNVNAYQYNFINLKKAEPSFGIPTELTYTVANSAYYFPVITNATKYSDSRKFSNNDDSLVLYNNNIGIGTATPDQRLSVVGVISATGRLYADKLPYYLEDITYAIRPTYGDNTASADYAFIGSGICNIATDVQSIVVGGTHNQALSAYSVVVGGFYNTASGYNSVINGGAFNQAVGNTATINGGGYNQVLGATSTIGGGSYNSINGNNSVIAGGSFNIANDANVSIGGGKLNVAVGDFSVISGGLNNCTLIDYLAGYGTVSGGAYNCAESFSVVGGGWQNTASGYNSGISSGGINTTSGYYSFIGGGSRNCTCGNFSSVLGGFNNYIDSNTPDEFSNHSSILGGDGNYILANCSSVVGGTNNKILHDNSFVLGSNIETTDPNTTYVENLVVLGNITTTNPLTGSGSGYYSTYSGYSFYSGQAETANFALTAAYDTTGRALSSIGEGVSIYQYGVNEPPYFSIEPKNGNNQATAYYSAIMGGHDNIAKDCNSFVIGSNIVTSQQDTLHVNNLLSLSSVKSTIFEGTSGLSFDSVNGGMGGFIDISGGNADYLDIDNKANGGNGGYITLKGSNAYGASNAADAGFINLNAGQLIDTGTDPSICVGKGGCIVGNGGDYTGVNYGHGGDAGYISFIGGSGINGACGGKSGFIKLDGGGGFYSDSFGGHCENGGSGGCIDLSGADAQIISYGGNGGNIIMQGLLGRDAGSIDTSGGGNINTSNGGGDINTSGSGSAFGGNINTFSTGTYNGGNIDTSNGGGDVITNGTGCIGLGTYSFYTQTMVCGTATSNRTICFPDNDGTIALRDTNPYVKSDAFCGTASYLPSGSFGANGGSINLNAGIATDNNTSGGTGGSINLSGGQSNFCQAGNGGSINIKGGDAGFDGGTVSNGGNGGAIDLSGGCGCGNGFSCLDGGNGGSLYLTGGIGASGGSINLSAGGYTSNDNGPLQTVGNGGFIHLTGGTNSYSTAGPRGANGGNAGSIVLDGGDGLNTNTPSSNGILLDGGHGGSISMTGGANANGGIINMNGNFSANAGSVTINAGGCYIDENNYAFNDNFVPAYVPGGNGGCINLSGGTGSAYRCSDIGSICIGGGPGGHINLTGGGGSSGGTINMNGGGGGFVGGSYTISGGNGGTITMNGGSAISNNNGNWYVGSGGSITLNGTGWYGDDGGNGGTITMNGGHGTSSNGGSITSNGACYASGGSLNMSACIYTNGGSIDTSNGGGSIITNGSGCIGLGTNSNYTQTMLCGTATSNRTICFPDNSGTVALLSDFSAKVLDRNSNYTILAEDNNKIIHFDTNTSNLSALIPDLGEGFNIAIMNTGTNTVYLSSSLPLISSGNKLDGIGSGATVYIHNSNLFAIGKL